MFDSHMLTPETVNIVISTLSSYSTTLTIIIALALDLILGEAKKYHYLVGFGWLTQHVESILNPDCSNIKSSNKNSSTLEKSDEKTSKFSFKSASLGGLSWTILVCPIPIIYLYYANDLIWYYQVILDALVLYLAIGLVSLEQHAMQVYRPLKSGDLTTARHFTGYLVSRETSELTPNDMARATTESMLENGHDSVIASLFYYIVGGAPLVIIHRLANTLDAMWGYRTPRYNAFGYASARLDDVLGFLSGKVCTLLYATQGNFLKSITNAYRQGNAYKSHNGGWVMAAGATVLNRTLGGSANYHGKKMTSVTLGTGAAVTLNDIPSSIIIIKRAALIIMLLSMVWETIPFITLFISSL